MAGSTADAAMFSKTNPGTTGDRSAEVRPDVYKQSGVDTAEADSGLNNIIGRVRGTWPQRGPGRVLLPIGYFANVIETDGVGIAICTDGVGSKTIIATAMGKYDTIGIDCVAMNVNDMICVGAKPLSLVDYIAIEKADAGMLDAIGAGLCKGAEMAQISISGGETAQLKDIVNGFDLVGMAIGRVDLDKILSGKHVVEGDVVIGVRSNGVHSNGLSLARKAFFESNRHSVNDRFDELGTTLGEELLRPTDIYVPEAMEILQRVGRESAHKHHQRRPAQPGAKSRRRQDSKSTGSSSRIQSSPSFNVMQRPMTARCLKYSTWGLASVTWLPRTTRPSRFRSSRVTVARPNASGMPSQIPSGVSEFTNESCWDAARHFKTKIDPFERPADRQGLAADRESSRPVGQAPAATRSMNLSLKPLVAAAAVLAAVIVGVSEPPGPAASSGRWRASRSSATSSRGSAATGWS